MKTKKGDHDWYVFCHEGTEYKEVMAKISHGSSYKTYPQVLWKRMKKFLWLDNNAEVSDLLECPMGLGDYLDILRKKKLVKKKPRKKK